MKNLIITLFIYLIYTLMLGCNSDSALDDSLGTTDTNQNADSDSQGGSDSQQQDDPDTDKDSDGHPDSDPPELSWDFPAAKQDGLASFALDCDPDLLTDDCDRNAPSPCIPDEPDILCDLIITDATNAVIYDGRVSIERRGRSSIDYPKPNYALEFRMADGETDNPMPCMGMGKEADWILDGAWMDRSFMRNDLIFDVFANIAQTNQSRSDTPVRYAPESRFGELRFNGNHQGIYRLVEKIKRDDDRIDIQADDGSGAAFIIKQDDDTPKVYADIGAEPGYWEWELIYPKGRKATQAQIDGIQQWMNALAAAIPAGNPFDYLDMESTVDWFLMQELAKNADAYMLSFHIYKDIDGKAHLVPWDFDLSFGQPTFLWNSAYHDFDTAEGWTRQSDFSDDLLAIPVFKQRLRARWAELREGPLSKEHIQARIDFYQDTLEPTAIDDNFSVWPIGDVDFRVVWDAYTIYDVSSYADEVSIFRQYISDRLTWIDANIESLGN